MSSAPPAKVIVDRQGPLHAEIVVVGRELLRGQLRDGNASWIAGELTRRGALVHRVTIVDDLERSIMNAVAEARGRGVHLIVTTGGLGPALDDRTLAGVAQAMSLPLTINPPARDMVEAAYRTLKDSRVIGKAGFTASREKMCFLPVGAEAIANPAGVAPGMLLTPVRTYCHELVFTLPSNSTIGDLKSIGEFGRRAAGVVIDTETLPPDERETVAAARIRRLISHDFVN